LEILNQWYLRFLALRGEWGYVVDIFLVVLAIGAVNLALRVLFRYLSRRVEESESVWDDALYYSLSGPLRALVWIVGLSVAAEIGGPPEDSVIGEFLPGVRIVATVAVIAWFLTRLIQAVERNIVKRSIRRGKPIDETTADAVAKLLYATVLITSGLVVLQSLGVSISGVLAFGGIGGFAIGFAAKDIIANFLGGVTVYLNRPFSVGDWIRSPDKDIEGVVEAVGWRATTVRRFDKRPLYVPNAVFTTVALENPSRMSNRRISETIGLRYDDAALVLPIVADIRKMLEQDEEIDQDQIILVYFNSFGPSSLDLMVYCFTRTTQWAGYLAAKQKVLMRCYEIIEEHGAEIAFPTTTVHVPAGLQLPSDARDEGEKTDV
jgi:MscS family membrane protein